MEFRRVQGTARVGGFKLVHFGLTRSNDAGPEKQTILAIAALPGTADKTAVAFSALRSADSQPLV